MFYRVGHAGLDVSHVSPAVHVAEIQNDNQFVSGLKVSPSLEGNKLQVSPVLAGF